MHSSASAMNTPSKYNDISQATKQIELKRKPNSCVRLSRYLCTNEPSLTYFLFQFIFFRT